MIDYEKLFAAQNEVDPRPDSRGLLVMAGFLGGIACGLVIAFAIVTYLLDS
ncbi:MAG: hypothetical protein ACYDC1_01350 [Limisphaerales bacterium]